MTNKNITKNADLEEQSLAIINSEVAVPRPFSGNRWLVVRQMIYATADFDLLNITRFSPGAVSAGISALRKNCHIITDTAMAKQGLQNRNIQELNCTVDCLKKYPPDKQSMEEELKTQPQLFVISDLAATLELLLNITKNNNKRPALIIAMPSGFIDTQHIKEILPEYKIPYISTEGRKGGPLMACAAINALAKITLEGLKK